MKMRGFQNPKARELFLKSLELDKEAYEMEDKEIKATGITLDTSAEIHTQAAGLRVLADDIEDGFVDENEIEM